MSELQDDKKVAARRKNPLKDNPDTGLEVTASLADQQLEELASKLDEMGMGKKIVDVWNKANADRINWLERQTKLIEEVDEFIDDIYSPSMDWASTLHLPTVLTVCKTYHGRMYAALLGVEPPFSMKSRTAANVERATLNEELMKYTLKDWCNEYEGVEDEVDKWLWSWITRGNGLLKGSWGKKFTRFKDVETKQVQDIELVRDPVTGEEIPSPITKEVEREVTRTEVVFNGPELRNVALEDVVIVGGEGDPKRADYVIEQGTMTASDLWTLVDRKMFRADVVKEVVAAGTDAVNGSEAKDMVKQEQKIRAGESDINQTQQLDRYRVLEAYMKVDVDGSGINSDVIVWVHVRSMKILRATYLRRSMKAGTIPYFNAMFHRRPGATYSAGLPELLYSLAKEIDAIHNIKLDVGILTSMPFGFYRPTTSTMKDDRLDIEPGTMIPLDNPQSDVMFPNLGVRTAFGFQEEAALQNQIDRLTSISDLNLGIVSGMQGASRTATGARALLGESSNNLNIYIQRMNRPWKRALQYTFAQLQQRLPADFQFRIQGDDGNSYWRQVKSRAEIEGSFDFELEANSANSNKQIEIEKANMIYQMTQNPIDLQLGIISPAERYEAIANQLRVNGVKDVSKYVRKPEGVAIRLSPNEMVGRVLAGIDVQLDPSQDIAGFLALGEHIFSEDELLGQFAETQAAALAAKMQEAGALMQALQAAQQQTAAIQQQQMNTQGSMQPANSQPVSITQPVGPGEGA